MRDGCDMNAPPRHMASRMQLLLRAVLIIALPIASITLGGSLMMRSTGRDQFPQTEVAASAPLHFRLAGYRPQDVIDYWTWLGPDGRIAEQRFLQADFFFPCGYASALLLSFYLATRLFRRPPKLCWLILPIAVTVSADLLENTMHLQQLGKFMRGEQLQPHWIQCASIATSSKMIFFWFNLILACALSAWVLMRLRPRKA
jgi:hypothetical protein